MTVEVSNTAERRRSTRFHLLIFRDQEPPLLNVIAFNCPVETVIAHRILPQGRFDQRISEHAQLRGARATKQSRVSRVVIPGWCESDKIEDDFAPSTRPGISRFRVRACARPGMTATHTSAIPPPASVRAFVKSPPLQKIEGAGNAGC